MRSPCFFPPASLENYTQDGTMRRQQDSSVELSESILERTMFRVLSFAIAALFSGLSTLPATASAGTITSAGSTTVQPAMKACGKAFRKQHPDTQIIIAGGGSSKGVKTIGRGKVDIGRASRNIKQKESAAFPDIKPVKIGTDGVAIVVHKSNPLSAISSDQVEQLFKGKITNWKEIGGNDGAVSLISLGSEHGTYELFSKHFHLHGEEKDGFLNFENGKAWIAFSQKVLMEKVAHEPNAIAFASIGVATRYAEQGDIKLLTLDGVTPTAEHVVDGSYKLSRPLLIITKGAPAGEVKQFVDFMLQPACQSIVSQLGYIPVK